MIYGWPGLHPVLVSGRSCGSGRVGFRLHELQGVIVEVLMDAGRAGAVTAMPRGIHDELIMAN